MKKLSALLALACAAGLLVSSCQTGTGVSRLASDQAVDLSGRWNDTDAQLVAEAMVSDVLKRAWLADFLDANRKKPVVIVGSIRNRSTEHIDAALFSKSIERELINSGKVSFVANANERDGLRAERLDQQNESSAESVKRLGQETGADFMLQGSINSVVDAVQGKRVVFYKIDLELINIESNEKVWIGTKEIKKLIEQGRVRL